MVDEELVADAVELVGRDAGRDRASTASSACAAIRPATRIALDGLGVLDVAARDTAAGAACPTYSGRSIEAGTGRVGGQAAGSQDSHPQSLENGCERRRSVA